MRRTIALLTLALAACDSSSTGFTPSAPPPTRPVAVAGDDFEALVSTIGVMLDGGKSYDPDSAAITYQWFQAGGTPVTLSSATVAAPTFDAPATSGALTFDLTVTSPKGTDTDTVVVAVKKLIVTAGDAWFVGYEKAGSLLAIVAGGTGPFTYEWTGIDPWLAVTGAATTTLSYTTPKLADLQNFPDRAEVAMLQRAAQGRLQLRIKVTDSVGDIDEDLVNFSAGPFAQTAADSNAAVGEPLFLNGGATGTAGALTSWAWTGTRPNGSAITFKRPSKTTLLAADPDYTAHRLVYIEPDPLLPGPYEVILTQNPGSIVKVISITAGKYTGVGNLTGTPPDPNAGNCAACHGGQLTWLADFANPWKETGHARMFETLLDPANPYHGAAQAKGHWKDLYNFGSSYSVDSRVVGPTVSPPGAHGGFVKQATTDGYVFKDSTWSELVRKHPKVAALTNVQCESCHGPGSEHAGDTTGIRKSYDANLCGRCHSRKQDLWEASSHGKPPIVSPSGSANCNGCHTAQGYVVEMRAQEGADPHAVLFAVSNINRPVIPYEDRRGTTCQACHEPHKKTAKMNATGVDPQLRAFGNVQFRNGAVANAGQAAVCYTCHQSRTDTRDGSGDMNVRRAPHDSTAAEMLSGTNGAQVAGWVYSNSPHGIPSRFVSPTKGENRQCLACHADVQPGPGAMGYNTLGGHTFNMKQGTGLAASTETTHPGGATVGGSKQFMVASGASWLKQIYTGDVLTITGGADAGAYTIKGVDGARQVTVSAPAAFTGGAATAWSITSVPKFNTASCTQCHTVSLDFEVAARGDYDGDSVLESVQDEVTGLRDALLAAVNAKLTVLVGEAATLNNASGRVKYKKTLSGAVRTFPGPSVTAGENPDISWATLPAPAQAEWLALYQAAYNHTFVGNDKSTGIHNTGYAVNLLQSSHYAVTGFSIGQPFTPFP